MTREEKLKILCTTSVTPNMHPDDFGKWDESLRAAIEALSAEPCENAIDRQAVLDGIEELKKSPWAIDKRGNGFEYLIKEALEVVADLCVKNLPPVTPNQKTGHWEWLTEDKYRCSNCNHETRVDECMNKPLYDFCPFCGAKMEVSENG